MGDKRPKVAVIANRLGNFGGGERWVYEMAMRLNDRLNLNIINPVSDKDTVRIAEKKLDRLFDIGNARITEMECGGLRHKLHGKIDIVLLLPSLKGLCTLNKAISESDVVYEISFSPFVLFWSILFAKLNGKRFVLGLHNPDFLVGQTGKKTGRLGNFIQTAILAVVKEMHVQTESQRKILSSLKYTGKTYYIPHYLYFKVNRKEVISYGSTFDVLLSGRLSVYQKGIDLLEEIVDKTVSKDNDITFTVVGSGEGKDIVESLEKRHRKNLRYLGFVSDEELKRQYIRSSLFILTSRYETPGLALLEAQSYGMPAVAFDVMGPKDIIIKKSQGSRIKPFDTERFSAEILRFKKLFSEDEKYRKVRIEIWSEIGKRYGEEAFVRNFAGMMSGDHAKE